MRNDAEAVVEGMFAAWRLQDIEATLSYCAEDMVYHVHQPEGVTGLGGLMTGKAQIRSFLEAVRSRWEFLYLAPIVLSVDGGRVRGMTQFRSLHRKTGLPLSGAKRHVFIIENGLIKSCEE